MSEQRFVGKVVVITGGGAGIGRAYGHRFAAEGAAIVVADLDPVVGERMVKELEANGHDGLSFPMDVRDTDAAARMADAAAARFGGIDILVNNAGIHLDHAQLPFTLDAIPEWRDVFDVNVIGALVCTAACREAMAARGGGAIINQSSMAAYGAGGAYSVVEVGVELAHRLDGQRARPRRHPRERHRSWPGRLGVGRRVVERPVACAGPGAAHRGPDDQAPGHMEDLADMALFLCSEQASFVTGQTILVDGGHTKKPT